MDYFSQALSSHLFLTDNLFVSIYVYKRFNIWNSFWMPFNFSIIFDNSYRILKAFIIFNFWIYCYFLLFYPIWKINIQTTTSKIYNMTFVLQNSDWIESKITSNHGLFSIALIFWKKWLKRFINNFICIIIY